MSAKFHHRDTNTQRSLSSATKSNHKDAEGAEKSKLDKEINQALRIASDCRASFRSPAAQSMALQAVSSPMLEQIIKL